MNEPISRLLTRKGHEVETVGPDASVFEAVERMNELHIGAVLVTNEGRPMGMMGIFTERDVMVRVLARSLDARKTPVREVMTKNPITIRSDITVSQAMRVITQKRCRHLPVCDGDELRGLISIGDLLSWLVRDQEQTIVDLHDYIRHP